MAAVPPGFVQDQDNDWEHLSLQEIKQAQEIKEAAEASIEDEGDYDVIQRDAAAHLPSEEYQSSYQWMGNKFRGLANGTFATLSSWMGARGRDYAMKLMINDEGMRKDVKEVMALMQNRAVRGSQQTRIEINAKIQTIVNKIPDSVIESMVQKTAGLVPNLTSALAGMAAQKAVKSIPLVGDTLNFSKILTTFMLPELSIAERQAKEMLKRGIQENTKYNQYVVEFIRKHMKKTLKVVMQYALEGMQLALEPVEITKHSILDKPEPYEFGANVTLKSKEAIIKEYYRALALKEYATAMGQNVMESVDFLRNARVLCPYNPDTLSTGLTVDAVSAMSPRFIADSIAQRIMSDNFSAVDANEKIKNAKLLAQQMGFELPKPSPEQMKELLKVITDENGHEDMFSFHRLIQKATRFAVSKISESLGFKRPSREIPEVGRSWSIFGDKDYTNLNRIRNIYRNQIEALDKLELDIMAVFEGMQGLREGIDISEARIAQLKHQLDQLSVRRLNVALQPIKVDNQSRLQPIRQAGEQVMTEMSDSIASLFREIDELQQWQLLSVPAANAPQRMGL